MNLSDITIINRDFTLMAFYKRDDEYLVDKSIFKITDDKISKYCQGIRENINTYRTSANDINIIIDRLEAQYTEFKANIDVLRVPAEEFNEYLRKSTEGSNIRKYRALKMKLKYAMIPFAHLDDRRIDDDDYQTLDPTTQSKSGQKNIILNRHNPFSDITIQNQEFIYPDTSGKFQTLQFNVGYTMAKIDNETTASVVLQPDFKITKSNERDQVANTITMDNSITTQMPETQGELELLYI